MANYEHVVVTRPDISPQQVDALVEDITRIVTDRNGKVERSEYWGLRNLAYPINKSRKGHYSLLNISGAGDVMHEIERRHRINEDVLRFLTVKVDAFSDEPSPVIARKDRDDRRRGRKEDGEGGFGGDRGGREERGFGGPREDRGFGGDRGGGFGGDRGGGFGGDRGDRGGFGGGGFGGGRGRQER